MIILGVDPGLAVTGYGVIETGSRLKLKEAGVIRTKSRDDMRQRLTTIRNSLFSIIREYKPDVLVLEKLYSHYRHPRTAISMAHARGVVCLAAGEAGISLENFSSTKIKKAVTGRGHASKLQVQGMVAQLLGLRKKPEPVDASDALAAAITYANKNLPHLRSGRG